MGLALLASRRATAETSAGRFALPKLEKTLPEYFWPAAITLLALLVRLVRLDDLPYAMGGDEGAQAMSAVSVLDSTLRNPFTTGWYSVPTLSFFVQAASIAFFGDSVGGVRVVTALLGAATVPASYLLVRRIADRWTAIVAALLLAVYHHHVHFSRIASHQIYDPFFAVLLLLAIDRSLADDRPFDWMSAGILLGLSQYFYFGARILPFVWVASIGYALMERRAGDEGLPLDWLRNHGGRLIGWTVLGAALAYLPLLDHYRRHPSDFNARTDQVSIFASGWLERERQESGASTTVLLLRQIRKSALLPILTPPKGWYRGPGVPFSGLLMAPFVVVGVGFATFTRLRHRWFPTLAVYAISAIGLAITEDPAATQRAAITAPLVVMFAALGLASVRRVGVRAFSRGQRLVSAAVTGLAVVIAAWNLRFDFLMPEPIARYADRNTLAATELARYLRAEAPRHSVYLAALPDFRYDGFQSLRFIAREARGTDVETPWTEESVPRALSGPAVFAFIPSRIGELPIVRRRFPTGRLREFHWVNGSLLLVVYDVRMDDHPGPSDRTPG